jgi:hypothetical protein
LAEHNENVYTRGIILNRPTNLFLSDDDFINSDGSPLEGSRQDNKWKIWFGGEVNGLLGDDPEIICLHSLENEVADQESEVILKGIKVRRCKILQNTIQFNSNISHLSLQYFQMILCKVVDITRRGEKDCTGGVCKCK